MYGDFYFYSFHAVTLNFAKSVKQNSKWNSVAKLHIVFSFPTIHKLQQ